MVEGEALMTLSRLRQLAPEITARMEARGGDVLALYVFGSQASGQTHAASDIDLAVLVDEPLKDALELEGELAELLGAEVDLVDLRRAPTVLQAQVVSEGERLLAKDFVEAARFETFVFSSYARLNEERREILEDIFARGSIHGG